MSATEMIALRKAGTKVKDIITLSGAPEWYVYDVMREARLNRGRQRAFRVIATTVSVGTVSATSRDQALEMARREYSGQVRIEEMEVSDDID